MKTIFALVLMISLQSQASLFSSDSDKAYAFKFPKFQGEVYEYEVKASDKNIAYEKAAQACFDHFKAGRHVSMEFGQDIIDVCANPRSNF